ELTARGAEADVRWTTPITGLSLLTSVTFAESQFGADPVAGLPLLAGSRAAFAPKWSGSVIARYQRSLAADLKVGGQIAVRYNSAYNTGSDLLPSKIQPAYSLVNARLWLAGDADRWAIEAFAENLTDERYYQVAFNAPFQTGTLNAFLGQPRTVGVTLRLRR
ncbi:MAG: TonB-dependent receptor, partial [Asticcacaulis sp.]